MSHAKTILRRATRIIRYSVLSLCVLFLAIHLMGLGHAVIPVQGTWNMMMRPDGTKLQREWVPLERISPHLVSAIIAAEDSRFCQHDGIDVQALNAAIEDNQNGGRRRGGSTITQQTAKNVFLWNGGGYSRKALEAWLALYIDTVWSKRRIMEVYLNVAEWGDGLYGAEAAAHARFGKAAAELTPYEAALLAAVLPSPNKWKVDPPGPYVSGRAAMLQKRARIVESEKHNSCLSP